MNGKRFKPWNMLASLGLGWQPHVMQQRFVKNPRAGGSLLALSVILGAFAGTLLRQPSIGVVAGTAIGIAICLAVWLADIRQGAKRPRREENGTSTPAD